MTKIQIFPTFREVTSNVSEYLPTTDFTQPHFLSDPVQRHLDSAFRLLRHDIFGPLKGVIGGLLSQPDVTDTCGRCITGNTRAHAYMQADIDDLVVDGALEATVSFATPLQLHKRSLPDQRQWWEGSSRLEPGSLVCFVSADEKSFLLFVVTKKDTKYVPKGKYGNTLVSNYRRPSVAVKLASETRQSFAILARMYVEQQEGLLVELPGLIPETFVPILENLQRICVTGTWPFVVTSCPTTNTRMRKRPGLCCRQPMLANRDLSSVFSPSREADSTVSSSTQLRHRRASARRPWKMPPGWTAAKRML
jgi:hypothetical protein